jgi:predicted ABC-type ATPase
MPTLILIAGPNGAGKTTVDIRRRFGRSLNNLVDHYLPLADRWVIWDNQISPLKLLVNHQSHTILQAAQVLK